MERRASVPLLDTKDPQQANNGNGNKTEGTEYIPARCRITKPNPPKPAQNPLQFVKVGPCDLYRSAQEQLKKVEVIKKVKQEFKEDGEDWQANLDNWKSSRRKRQEHIIERVVEIRSFEQDGDKGRRRSKTFSEMLEDRNSRRRKLSNLQVYASGADDDNDLSDLGISTRKESLSGESSLDETADTANNNKCEYTYESAIQDYKSRVKRRSFNDYPIESNKNEDRRFSLYSLKNDDSTYNSPAKAAADLPKIDISSRKQLFETGKKVKNETTNNNHLPDELTQSKSIKERLKHLEKCTEESLNIKKATKLLTGDIMTVRDRLSNLVSHTNQPPMYHCQSLDSLDQHNSQFSRPIKIAEHVQSLEGLDYCDNNTNYPPSGSSTELLALSSSHCVCDTDREDSGIQTADVSCSVSQADDPDDDSDTMPNIKEPQQPTSSYLSHIDLPLEERLEPIELPESNETEVDMIPMIVSPTTKSSDTSSVVEELITCTINLDLTRNKILFDEDDPNTDPFLAPPKSVEPPKEKPPPPPIEPDHLTGDDDDEDERPLSPSGDQLKRFNSTKRIKNEIRNKRSSFLGIEGVEEQFHLFTVTKPQDAVKILQEEMQLEKEMYRQQSQQYATHHMATSSFGSVDVESRDSGVELETTSNSTPLHKMNHEEYHDEDEITKREREIIENLEKEEQWRHSYHSENGETVLHQNSTTFNNTINNHFSNQVPDCTNEKEGYRYDNDEDVIRVERELLELEQEELERQREDLLYQNRKAKLLESPSTTVPKQTIGLPDPVYLEQNNRSSQHSQQQQQQQPLYNNYPNYYSQQLAAPTPYSKMQLPLPKSLIEPSSNTTVMSRHALHALSAAPKSKLITTDSWIQSQPPPKLMLKTNYNRENYNQHWLIQEAEERRLSQANNNNRLLHHFDSGRRMSQPPPPIPAPTPSHILSRKDLPVPRGPPITPIIPPPVALRPNRVMPPPPPVPVSNPTTASTSDLHDKMLSVSGKKKCSHCGDELGRGAAMIIESLRLFYHMDCFKCCVCHVQLGDGLMGTDVRVRNHKLHCQNCYSSDDGVKFSCV